MILDDLLEIADAASVAAAAGTIVVGDVIDLSHTTGDIGIGDDMWIVIRTQTEIITAGAAGTLTFFVVSDALTTLGGGSVGGCTTHITTNTFVTDDAGANSAALNAGGTILAAKLPSGNYERYLGVLALIGTTTITAGNVDIFLVKNYASWSAFADATN